MVNVIDIMCFGSVKILSIRFEADELILTEKELQEYFSLANKNLSLENQEGVVPRFQLAEKLYAFKITSTMPKECTVSTFSDPADVMGEQLGHCGEYKGALFSSTKKQYFTNVESPILMKKSPSTTTKLVGNKINSILSLIRGLPIADSLLTALMNAPEIIEVDELPAQYNGDIVFELPISPSGKPMAGMEQRYDGHVWVEYRTCTKDSFAGVVRRSSCGGHLRCCDVECPYYERTKQCNQSQWKGKLKNIPSIGFLSSDIGTLVCKHCLTLPECLAICEACIYYCYAEDINTTTRCVIHSSSHRHPVADGVSRLNEASIHALVQERATYDLNAKCKKVETGVANDMIMDMLLDANDVSLDSGDLCVEKLLERVTPLVQRKRIQRSMDSARQNIKGSSSGLEALLDLKLKTDKRYPYFHSILFPKQLANNMQPHVFKMSSVGPASGVDLVNQMRKGGPLQDQFVHFDHVHRTNGWTTMSAHVYHPFVRELLTIAVGEFKVENTDAQIQFWNLMNERLQQSGFENAQFAGFMADEAQANWLAVRAVFNGGRKNVMLFKERSCSFHWEKSMLEHTRTCIKPQFQEEHKHLCRRWRDAPSEVSAASAKDKLVTFWSVGHAFETELQTLETWLSWWEIRGFHWAKWTLMQEDGGPFKPTVNLSESKHASMRAAIGYAQQISLFSASAADLALSVLQSAHYKAYLTGRHEGSGPNLNQLKKRFMSGEEGVQIKTSLVDLSAAVLAEQMIEVPQNQKKDQKSVMRKRRNIDAKIVLETDSHRPEFENVTIHLSNKKKNPLCSYETPRESEVDQKDWAIRRTPPKSQSTCWGMLEGSSKRCGSFVHDKKEGLQIGVPAPCFKGRRQYKDKESWQMFYFCPSSVIHCTRVDEQIQRSCGPAPLLWKVAKGTSLSIDEIGCLLAAGFLLDGVKQNVSTMQSTPCNVRPKSRGDGRIVRWKEKISKAMQECINRALVMEGEVVRESIISQGESHIFWIATSESKKSGLSYAVNVCEFPRCSCAEFTIREQRKESYMPCEHMYFVFIRVFGLQPMIHKFMHQGAMTKLEIGQAISGHRNIPSSSIV